jgi:hypothetical protein
MARESTELRMAKAIRYGTWFLYARPDIIESNWQWSILEPDNRLLCRKRARQVSAMLHLYGLKVVAK